MTRTERTESRPGGIARTRTDTELVSGGGILCAGVVIVAVTAVVDVASSVAGVPIPGSHHPEVVLSVVGVVAAGAGASAVAEAGRHHDRDRRRHDGAATALGGDAERAVLSLVEEPYETVEGTHRRLRALERLLRERGDRRAVFLTVYARVTGEVADAIESGAFENPDWVADYLVTFANFYRRAMYDFETGRADALPTAWRLAFRAAERERTLVLQHAVLGVNAHVTFDLAFALLAVGVGGDRRAKYRDHRRINRVLRRLVDVTLDRLAERYAPGIGTLAERASLVELGWFGALLVGREAAWWAALVLAESGGRPVRAVERLVGVASSLVARAVVGPTAHPLAARAVRSVVGRLGLRGL
jgi:hypothetical protein